MYCQLKKTYKSKKRSFSIDIKTHFQDKAINVLYGNSGAGKTSLLRLLSGLDKADQGVIKINQTEWFNSQNNFSLALSQRNIAYVFQDYGLFPNMTVIENFKFVKKNLNHKLLKELLKNLDLENLLNSKPDSLSGGQQQRVALARAILQEPHFLFLDEPLTAIDETLRNKIQNYLIDLQQQKQFTIIMVSHNLQEVLKMAHYVCVLKDGQIIHQGKPDILLKPNTENTIKAKVLSINEDIVCAVIGIQKVDVQKNKILTSNYNIGEDIEIKFF